MTTKPYVINRMSNRTAEILIYQPIGDSWFEEGLTAKQFADDLKAAGDVRRIDVRINSVGGSVFDGLAIYNALANHAANIVAHIDGVALSMASVIAMAADTINMAENGLMMVHNPRGAAMGEAKDLMKVVEALDKSRDSIVMAYRSKTQLDEDRIRELMDAETWMTASEAKELGFVDDVSPALQVAASFDLIAETETVGLVVPQHVAAQFKKEKKMSQSQPAQPVQPQPATLAELQALGADAQFIIDQLSANATLGDAQRALVAKLQAEVETLRNEKQSLLLQQQTPQPAVTPTATPQAAPPPTATPQAATTQPPAEGIAPLANNSTPGNATPAPPKVVDHGEIFDREFKRHRAAGMSAKSAMDQVYKDFPELKQQILADAGRI